MKLAIDMTACREPASGVQLAISRAVQAELPFLREHECLVYATKEEPQSDCLRPKLSSCLKRPLCRIAWQQAIFAGDLRRNQVDVLQAMAYTLPLRLKIPALLVVHDLIALEHPEFCSLANRMQMRFLLPQSARRARYCLCPSAYVADSLRNILNIPATRLQVVPWGVDYPAFATPSTTPLPEPLQAGLPYFLFVGNIEPKKNLETLLKAYSRIADSTGTALVVAGRYGWNCSSLAKNLRHWPGPGQVFWLGRVAQPLLVTLYQHALACIMPSWTEGFGLPVLEAMAAGTPVLHSNHPALQETAGGAGREFAPDSPDCLADLMLQLAGSPALRREMIIQGQERARLCPWKNWGRQAAQIAKAAAQ